MNADEASTTRFELTERIREAIELVLRDAAAISLSAKDKEAFRRFLSDTRADEQQKQARKEEKEAMRALRAKKAKEEEEQEQGQGQGQGQEDQSQAAATTSPPPLSKAAKKRQKKKNHKNKNKNENENEEHQSGSEAAAEDATVEGAGVGDLVCSTEAQVKPVRDTLVFKHYSKVQPSADEQKVEEEEDEEEVKQTITLALVMRLSEILVEMKKKHKERLPEGQPVYIHELTRGSQLVVRRLPQRKKDPAVQEKLRQVRIQLENRKYEQMTRKISGETNRTKLMEEHAELKSYKSQMEIGINIIVTMATLFVGGYYLTKVSTGNHLYGLAVGVVLAAGALMLESWLFIIAGNRIDKSVEERKRRMKKIRRPLLTNEIPKELKGKY
eukprot:TRINITY_DN8157_c0_g3_i1.p1 TRINITY_DN8157_c0_g3~~TRINITY_DN8157_c0_g3_i1.p1  ORF type:complete len:385 (+),score=143.50 TRINITY_DN8157_c0_g3_i1:173-1327(+)